MDSVMRMMTQHMLDWHLQEFDRYIDLVEGAFAAEHTRFEEWFEKEVASLSHEEANEAAQPYFKEFFQWSQTYPRMFAQSTLISIWSIFEHEMVHLAQRDYIIEAPLEDDEAEAKADKKFSTIDDVGKYWGKRLGNKPLPVSWADVKSTLDVRNQIVHDKGRRHISPTPKSKKKERSDRVDAYVAARKLANKPGLAFDGNELAVTAEYCRETAELCKEFYSTLVSIIPETKDNLAWFKRMRARAEREKAKKAAEK